MLYVRIVGPLGPARARLEDHVRRALDALGLDALTVRSNDVHALAALGFPAEPVLLVDGRVLASGWVPEPEDVVDLLPRS